MSKLDDITDAIYFTGVKMGQGKDYTADGVLPVKGKEQIKDLMLELVDEVTEDKPLQPITVMFVKDILKKKVSEL